LQEQIDTVNASIEDKKTEAEAEEDDYKPNKEEKKQIKGLKAQIKAGEKELADSIEQRRLSCSSDEAKELLRQQRMKELHSILESYIKRQKRKLT
jgi:hypothetical protein